MNDQQNAGQPAGQDATAVLDRLPRLDGALRPAPWLTETTADAFTGGRVTNWDEARLAAGLTWEPVANPAYSVTGMTPEGHPIVEKWDDFFQVVRDDNGKRLAVPKASYPIISHADMGLVVDAILGKYDNGSSYTVAAGGEVGGGTKVWVLLELGDPLQIGADPSATKRYLLLINAHDGSAALRAMAVNLRIFCSNAWRAAEMEATASDTVWTFHHRANWRDKVDQLLAETGEAVSIATEHVDAYVCAAKDLLRMPVDRRVAREFTETFFPPPGDDVKDPKRAWRNVTDRRDTFWGILNGPTCEGIAGTAYGLVQAAGEYLDHERGYRTRDSYTGRTLLAMEQGKVRAHRLALQLAA